MARHRWPEIVEERRAVIDARTAEGETCTLIAVRHTDGQLGLYYHGAIRTSAMLPPPVYEKLITSLTRLTAKAEPSGD
ncbi:MAG TPA: hypothetical protein VFQ77_14590 [Pseudonocardiaceae bacterium]|jgi:hypothetical protein|nr:hypothetical protein [Pseudonocardiaceae bacterium]